MKKLELRTVSLFAGMLLVWSRMENTLSDDDFFAPSPDAANGILTITMLCGLIAAAVLLRIVCVCGSFWSCGG